jgi:DNA-binding CsgD family transcriptional regulator
MARDSAIGMADLHVQMKITNKLLAAQLKERVQQKDLIRLLMTTGASDQEIADVLGTTPGTVSITKSRIKKEAAAKSGGKAAAADGNEPDA